MSMVMKNMKMNLSNQLFSKTLTQINLTISLKIAIITMMKLRQLNMLKIFMIQHRLQFNSNNRIR